MSRLDRKERRATEGAPVEVAHARNQPEAEFVQELLMQQGVPSTLRRSAGSDVPGFMAGGPRDVLVPARDAQSAREYLPKPDLGQQWETSAPGERRLFAIAGLALAVPFAVVIVAALIELFALL